MERVISKKFNFGKIAFAGKRKINSVEVEISLTTDDNGLAEFTASGLIWNGTHTDGISGGQNLDTIKKYVANNTFDEIYDLWKKYHLNGMNAGTIKQEEALKKEFGIVRADDYSKHCEYLKSIGLYEADLEDGEIYPYGSRTGYKYGSGWIHRTIKESDLNRIKGLLAA